jgi:hypothetical protein
MAPDDAAAERPTVASPKVRSPGAAERSCEHPHVDDVELSEDTDGFVRPDLQCRQITASGRIDSLQYGHTPPWPGMVGSMPEPQCLHLRA